MGMFTDEFFDFVSYVWLCAELDRCKSVHSDSYPFIVRIIMPTDVFSRLSVGVNCGLGWLVQDLLGLEILQKLVPWQSKGHGELVNSALLRYLDFISLHRLFLPAPSCFLIGI